MLSFVLTITIITLICGTALAYNNQHLKHYKSMAIGAGYLQHLQRVLEHIPQHRGMANAFLNGDQTFLEKMTEMQRTIDHDIHKINEYSSSHPISTLCKSHWQSIESGWMRLKQDIKQISPNENFERHSTLIKKVLYLISDTSEEMKITAHPNRAIQEIAYTSYTLIPQIIETIGQARGIGSGAAARGKLLTAVRIKLQFLHDRLDSAVMNAYSGIRNSLEKNDINTQITQTSLPESSQSTQQFLATITTNMLGEHISISANDYFSKGSIAFDSNINLLNAITKSIEDDIRETLPQLKYRIFWPIIIYALVLIIALMLA